MTETVSLAGITEIPLVIINVQRPGPATGLPTWTAQGDLNLANQRMQASMGYYQRAISELQSITGALGAPEQQQQSQRKEQGATS